MRVTSGMQFQQTVRNLQTNFAEMIKLQDQIASGLRLRRPSDGPADAAQVQRNTRDDTRLETHLANIRDTGFTLQASVDALTETRELLTQVQDIAIQGGDGSSNPSADEALAQQLDASLDQLIRIANRRLPDGRYLFAGTASETIPFVVSARDVNGRPTNVSYQGSEESSEVLIGRDQTVTALISGRVFQGQGPNGEARNDPNTTDAFRLVMSMRDDIRNTRNLSQADRSAAITGRLAELEKITAHVVNTLGTQAVKAEVLAQSAERLPTIQLRLKEANSALESVDVAKAITDLQQRQGQYELALSLASRLSQLDLTQYLN